MFSKRVLILFFFMLWLLYSSHAEAQISFADSVEQKISSQSLIQRSASLNNLANELISESPDKAIELCQRTLEISGKLNSDSTTAKTLNILGRAYDHKGDFSNALNNYLKALKIYESLDYKEQKAKLLSNIVGVYRRTKDYNKATQYAFVSLKLFEELNDDTSMAMVYNNIGGIYYDQNSYPKTVEYWDKAIKIFERIKNKNGVAVTSNNLGSVYTELEEYDKAQLYYQKALDVYREQNDPDGIAICLVNIGYVLGKRGNTAEAISSCLQSLKIAKEIKSKEGVLNVYDVLSEIYERDKNFKEAFRYQSMYAKLKDTIYTDESTRSLAEMSTVYETEKKENTIKIQQADLKIREGELGQQKIIRNGIIVVLMLVSALAFFILRSYNEKKKANMALQDAYQIIEHKNKDITDSINYAQRIQQAILPTAENFRTVFPESFILFKPKDVVSGDFYFLASKDDKDVVAVVDCTGHGVPGAFMSLIGKEILDHIVYESGITTPSEILTHLDKGIMHALKQNNDDRLAARDGMDISICSFDKKNNLLTFAGAMRPLFIAKKEKENSFTPLEIKGDKNPIGGYSVEKKFTDHEISLNKGDTAFLFSDGYADQFGGPNGKKLMTSKFKNLLLSSTSFSCDKQKTFLENTLAEWKGELEQVDDVLVIGIKF